MTDPPRTNCLLVIVPDALSALVQKGEITDRYYNPGNVFSEVHILTTSADRPEPPALQRTVGDAELHLHSLPQPTFRHSLGWQRFLLGRWLNEGVKVAERIGPALMRVHGDYLNGSLAAAIRKRLGVPMVVSLHINPDVDLRGRARWWPEWKERLVYQRMLGFEEECLRAADVVIPVYEPIRPYAERHGARSVRVCYNVLNPTHLRRKASYELRRPPRILSVGRQFKEKNPENLIRAVAGLDVELTLVGDGEYHDYLVNVARSAGAAEKVRFLPAVPNDELCEQLPDFDVFATHSEYFEMSKAVLEALLAGLPVVLNRRRGAPVPELQTGSVVLVENTVDGYRSALEHLLGDDAYREALGQRAYAEARERYAPEKTEQAVASLYREFAHLEP